MRATTRHHPIVRALPAVLLVLLASTWASEARAACKAKGDRPQVFVKARSAVRRGPGLNYPPSALLDDGRCVTLAEVSLDENWVLVEDDEKRLFGWVPASALDADSRELLSTMKGKTGPIGSGQERGYVTTKASTSLLARPDTAADVRKVLPPGSRLLGLSMSEDAKWVEVRDERGGVGWVVARALKDDAGTLAALPKTSGGLKTGLATEGEAKDAVVRGSSALTSDPLAGANGGSGGTGGSGEGRARREPGPAATSVEDTRLATPAGRGLQGEIETALYGLGGLPTHELDSNGQGANRRYTLRALGFGARIDAHAPLGALRPRLAYSFILLSGVHPKNDGTKTVAGQSHDARILLGYPIDLGRVRIVPEAGYALLFFDMQPGFTGEPQQFVSSHAHGLALGASASILATDELSVELEAGGQTGTTFTYPFQLGSSGLMIGARGSAGIRWTLAPGLGLGARYDLLWQRSPFEGVSSIDPTLTEATLIHLEHGFSLGIALTL